MKKINNKERLIRRLAAEVASMSPTKRTYRLALGFGALLVLMLVITIIAVGSMDAGQRRLNQVVSQEMMKAQLAAEMRLAAHERTAALHQMLLLTDPFDRDEQLMVFRGMANVFIMARERLLALPLDEDEQALLRRLGELTIQAAPLQEQVVGLMSAGQSVKAQVFLIEHAIPAQNRALEALIDLQALQEQRAAVAVAQADRAYRQGRGLMIALSAVVLVLGAGIALGVLRSKARGDQALHDEKERALVTLRAIGDAVIRTDGDGRIEYLNSSAVQMTGWDLAQAKGRAAGEVLRLMREQGQTTALDVAQEVLIADKATFDLHQQMLQSRGGGNYSVEVNAVPIRDQAGAVTGVVIVLHDVTEIRALSRELVYHATHDSLTGLLNRREFDHRLTEAMVSACRSGCGHLLCYLDLDLFKAINDVCGHLAGDELLRQVGMRLRNAVRPADVVARIGGDEFAILLADCVLAEGQQIGDEIRRVVREHRFTWDNKSFDLGVSVGVVPISPSAGTLHDVLRTADHACRKAKEQGRNRVFVVQDGPTPHREEVGWAETLGMALADNGFALYGQWVYPLANGACEPSHCELLLRLRRDGNLVSPSVFLPAAERYHIMPAIDRWVIREALVTLAQHASPPTGLCFNINLSGQSLCDPDFLEFVLTQFEETGMSPARICFEITETAAIINMTSAIRFITRLSDIGCCFALDDFGSGLSSFGYLKRMRVQYIKIDGVFVRDVADDPVDRAMVWCINEMAHVMDIQTIAEYVETEAVRDELRAIGVDFGQGVFMASPRPLGELLIDAGIHRASAAQRAPRSIG
jgi:diguanylate cyclase (GGDEF)-like protein/PAS domain S-box-containing protein